MTSDVPFTEPIAVPDIFVSGIGRIETAGGGNLRFTFFTVQQSLHGHGPERVIVARLVMPSEIIPAAALAATMAVEGVAGAVGHTLIVQRH